MMAPKPPEFATIEALESELKDYLAALPAGELDDETLPPPLAYSELSRNGRDDLARAVLDYGGYIQFSKRFGLRWTLPKKEMPPPMVEVDNFDPTKVLRTGFLKLGNARKATEDILETKSLDELPRRQPPPAATKASTGLGKLASLLEPARAPYVNTEDELPLRQLLVDLQLSLTQRANTLLLAWLLAVAFGPNPAFSLDGEELLVARSVALSVLTVQSGLGVYAATLASAQQRNPLVWLLKTALGGAPALSELRSESTRIPPPPSAAGNDNAQSARPPPSRP